MGVGVRLVEAQSSLVFGLCLLEVSSLEHEVTQVDHSRDASRIRDDGCAEIFFRALAVSPFEPTDAALGKCCRDILAFGDRRSEKRSRLLQVAALIREHAIGEVAYAPRHITQRALLVAIRKSPAFMRIDVVTLFPQFFEPIVGGSILGRAQAKGLVSINVHDLWSWVPDGERADDAPYGGGPGMVLRLGPLVSSIESLLGSLSAPPGCRVIVPSPAGRRFDHLTAEMLAAFDRLLFVCGHYEAIDERFFDLVEADELSLGDFVLTGGEIATLAFVDAVVRLVPGAIDAESIESDSFAHGGLDWPHFTRPAVFRGHPVPEVLLSGDHERIAAWRKDAARSRTATRRPDLMPKR